MWPLAASAVARAAAAGRVDHEGARLAPRDERPVLVRRTIREAFSREAQARARRRLEQRSRGGADEGDACAEGPKRALDQRLRRRLVLSRRVIQRSVRLHEGHGPTLRAGDGRQSRALIHDARAQSVGGHRDRAAPEALSVRVGRMGPEERVVSGAELESPDPCSRRPPHARRTPRSRRAPSRRAPRVPRAAHRGPH